MKREGSAHGSSREEATSVLSGRAVGRSTTTAPSASSAHRGASLRHTVRWRSKNLSAAHGPRRAHMKVLVIDIGGSHVKLLATGQSDPIRFDSDSHLTPDAFVARVRDLTHDWQYDVVSLGYPGTVGRDGPVRDPGNLGSGWVGYDFAAAFGKPVRVVNDASMQALGGYDGGR